MIDVESVQEFLDEKKAAYVLKLRVRPSDGTLLATVSSASIGDKAGGNRTSRRQMVYLKKAVRERFERDLEFLITQSKAHSQMEEGLVGVVHKRFPETVSACFLSLPDPRKADVWIEFDQQAKPDEGLKDKIHNVVRQYLGLLEIELRTVHWSSNPLQLPSLSAILRAIKASAPVTSDSICATLSDKGFSGFTKDWLESKLDLLRKRGLILRQEDKGYVLTEIALSLVPHGKHRGSSDVERALALGRRKW